MVLKRAYSLMTVKSADEDKRVIVGMATTPTPDRTGDIVDPRGAQFQLPIPLLMSHDSSQPIGHVTQAKVTDSGIEITAQMVKVDEPGKLKERLDEAWQLIKSGLVGGLSIGFRPIEEARLGDSYSYRYLKWLWLELSACVVPANGDCSITNIRSIDQALRRTASGAPGARPIVRLDPEVVKALAPGASGQKARHPGAIYFK